MSDKQPYSPAEMYEEFYVPAMFGPLSDVLIQHASPGPGERVLDVACGTGTAARKAAALVGSGGKVTAIDINPGMVEVARKIPPPDGTQIEWRVGDATILDVPARAFDLILCQQGLQFFPDCRKALSGFKSALADGGRVCIAVWQTLEHHPVWQAITEVELRHLSPLGVSSEELTAPFGLGKDGALETLLKEAGFSGIEITQSSIDVRFPVDNFIEKNERAYAAVIPQFVEDPPAFDAFVKAVVAETKPVLELYQNGDMLNFEMHTHIGLARV